MQYTGLVSFRRNKNVVFDVVICVQEQFSNY